MNKKLIVFGLIMIFLTTNLSSSIASNIKNHKLSNNEIILNNYTMDDTWGLLIGSVSQRQNNLKVCQIMKEKLCEGGWQENHIRAISHDKDCVMNGFDWVQSNSDSDDIILIYLDGHGQVDDKGGFFWLNSTATNTNKLYYTTLNEKLNNMTYKAVLLVIKACYSGSAIPVIQKENRVIFTSTKANLACTKAFGSELIDGLTVASDILGDKNGVVTDEELKEYIYFEGQNRWSDGYDHPQFQDNYTGDIVITNVDTKWDQYQIADNSEGSDFEISGGIQVRQSFVPTKKTITKIMTKTGLGYVKGAKINVKIYDSNCVCIADKTVIDNNPCYYRLWHNFVLPDMTVIPGEKYYILYSIESDGHFVWWGNRENDLYSDGEASFSYDNGKTWESKSFFDFTFITFGSDQTENHGPYFPGNIDGESSGKINVEYEYSFSAIDPDGDDLIYYIDWGDDSDIEEAGPHYSGYKLSVNHTWKEKGTYTLKIKAKDSHGLESNWKTLELNMAKIKNKPYFHNLIFRFFKNYTNFLSMLQSLLKS